MSNKLYSFLSDSIVILFDSFGEDECFGILFLIHLVGVKKIHCGSSIIAIQWLREYLVSIY